jgi:hypothetical protein
MSDPFHLVGIDRIGRDAAAISQVLNRPVDVDPGPLGPVADPKVERGREQALGDHGVDELVRERMKGVDLGLQVLRDPHLGQFILELPAGEPVEHEDPDPLRVGALSPDEVLDAVDHGGGLARAGNGEDTGVLTTGVADDGLLFGGERFGNHEGQRSQFSSRSSAGGRRVGRAAGRVNWMRTPSEEPG